MSRADRKRKNAEIHRQTNREEIEKTNIKRKNSRSMRERFADSMEVSKELTLDVAKITLFGIKEITVENYICVSEYTENIISLSAKPKSIKIQGKGLEINAMTKEIIYASGSIDKIEFL